MPKRTQFGQRLHEQAISILKQHIRDNIGLNLEANASCNECTDALKLNLVENGNNVERNRSVGPVRPDLAIFDSAGQPIRFIEIVDSHKPQSNVHEYALENKIEVIEFHLNAEREFAGPRRNWALDASLTVKARLEDLKAKRLNIDAHTLICQRPKCKECSSPFPLRAITISTKDCWKCGQNVNVAMDHKDDSSMEQDDFTNEELEFARENGVILERRFSSTAMEKYLANVCTNCDKIQGNWFLYKDPFHDRFTLHQTERQAYGPYDTCSTKICLTHYEYFDYTGNTQCPECVREAERVMCPNVPDRECFYPERCQENVCYFLGRQR